MATQLAEPDEALEEQDTSDDKLGEVFDRAMRRFGDDVVSQLDIREQALLARRFCSVPGAQWDGPWGEQYENSIKVEINKVQRGVRKIENDYRQNRITVDFRTAGGQSNSETADTLDGLHRADSYHFKAMQARDNAFSEMVKGGFGAYRLTNEWADPYDKDSDEQRINPALIIVDADQRVFFDANSKLYDKSDARYAYVLTAMTRGAYKDEYDDDCDSWDDEQLGRDYDFEWYTPDVVLICEYYEVEDHSEKLWTFTHKLTQEELRYFDSDISEKEARDLLAQGYERSSRKVERKRVRKYVMNGQEVMADKGYVAGSMIPIVPVYGMRDFIDNKEHFKGHVSDKMDAQRLYNSNVSKLAETNALAPREVPIFLAEQMPPNLAKLWAEQNINRHPYALVAPVMDPATGGIAAMGPIGKIDPPQLSQVTAALLTAANNDLTEDDQDSAEEVKANVSEEAMDVAAARVDAKSGTYLDNMRQSVQREGEIYLSMAADIYFEPGRKIETMSEDGEQGEAELHQSFTDNQGVNKTINDFTRGRYNVVADVTEATSTRRDKAVRNSLNIAQIAGVGGDAELANVMVLTAVMNQEGEGLSDAQAYARKRLVSMGVVQPNDEEKQEMEQASQNQPPDPTAMLAQATAAEKAASAALKQAQAQGEQGDQQLTAAKTLLTMAQAQAIGGPEEAPAVPDGLEAAHKLSEIDKNRATAESLRTHAALAPVDAVTAAHNAQTNRLKILRGRDLPTQH